MKSISRGVLDTPLSRSMTTAIGARSRNTLSRHHPPPGLAFGEPDDRPRRGPRIPETPAMESISRGIERGGRLL
jgi:hypothetical protein